LTFYAEERRGCYLSVEKKGASSTSPAEANGFLRGKILSEIRYDDFIASGEGENSEKFMISVHTFSQSEALL